MGRTPGRNSNSRRVSGVLRAARGQAAGPRGSKSRKSSAHSPPHSWKCVFNQQQQFATSVEQQRAPTSCSPPPTGAADCAALRAAEARTSSLKFASARHPFTTPTFRMRPIRSQFKRTKPTGPTATSVAGLRGGRLRPARLVGSQKHSPFVFGRSQRRTNIKAETASKRRCASPPHPGAAGRPLTRGLSYSLAAQSTAQLSALCQPHCGYAIAPPRFRAPCAIQQFRLEPKIVESLL